MKWEQKPRKKEYHDYTDFLQHQINPIFVSFKDDIVSMSGAPFFHFIANFLHWRAKKNSIRSVRLWLEKDVCRSVYVISGMDKCLSGRGPIKTHWNKCCNWILWRLWCGWYWCRLVYLRWTKFILVVSSRSKCRWSRKNLNQKQPQNFYILPKKTRGILTWFTTIL